MVSTQMKCGLLMGFGALGLVTGVVMVILWPPIYMAQLRKMMVLTNESQSFEIWHETPIPMYLEFFMFNITNVDDVLEGNNVSIRVDQLGPYVFRERHLKANITWNENSTVTFYNQRWWEFQPEMSNGTLSDYITSINPVVATIAHMARHYSRILKVLIDAFLRSNHNNMFLTANASDWLFEGISDPIIDIAEHLNLPLNIPFDKFAWFYTRNGSMEYDGVFLMNTGADNFNQLGNVEKWRYSNRTMYRDECGEVKGSTGELWAPELGQEELHIFSSDICTYLTVRKDKNVELLNIDGVQYAVDDSVFDNGHHYPEMACFCHENSGSECMPSGALNVSECRFGAPAFVSLPHFLYADPSYLAKVDGLQPTEEHKFRLALEMFTGMPLEVAAQLQINLLVRHSNGISIINALPQPEVMVPMFWFRQEMRMSEDYVHLASFALRMRYAIVYAMYALTAVGVLLLTIGIVILVKNLLKSPDTTPFLDDTTVDEQ